MRSARLRTPFITLAALSVILFSVQFGHADDACPNPGTRPATADDAVVKNGIIKVGTCYNPSDPTIGISDEQAKQYLETLYTTPGNCSRLGLANPSVDGIEKLDSQFAVKLAALLKAAPMKIGINSAFRTQQAQQCANPKVANSNHSRGCAVDLGYNQNTCSTAACQWVVQNAGKYGLQIRMQRAPEWNHIEPIACAGKSLGPVTTAPGGYQDFEDANPVYNPIPQTSSPFTYGPTTFPGTPQLTTPISPISTSPAQTAPTQSTPQICNPSYTCSNNTMYYQTTSCTTQVYQVCVYGCDGNACKTASTTSSSVGNIGNLFSSTSTGTSTGSGSDNSNSNSNTTNISDILKSLTTGDMFTATDVGTSVPLTLHIGTSTITTTGHASSSPIGGFVASGTIQTYQPVGSQSTFQTQDLSNVPAYTPQSTSVVFSILDGMKNALLSALNFLRSLAVR